jgi:hypothetical protein
VRRRKVTNAEQAYDRAAETLAWSLRTIANAIGKPIDEATILTYAHGAVRNPVRMREALMMLNEISKECERLAPTRVH